MSGVSSLVLVTPPPGLGRGACHYTHEQGLIQQTAFADAMHRNRVQEEPEDPIPQEEEDLRRNRVQEEPEDPIPQEEEDLDWQ